MEPREKFIEPTEFDREIAELKKRRLELQEIVDPIVVEATRAAEEAEKSLIETIEKEIES